jgi:hypothetical protein
MAHTLLSNVQTLVMPRKRLRFLIVSEHYRFRPPARPAALLDPSCIRLLPFSREF